MISAGGEVDLDLAELRREIDALRQRVKVVEDRLELVEAALTSRGRGWVLRLARFLARGS